MAREGHSREMLVLTDLRFGFGRQIVRGAIDYARRHPPWTVSVRMLHDEPRPGAALPRAVLFTAALREFAAEFIRRGVRAVACSGGNAGVALQVRHDNLAIGQMAADHLIGHGLRRFAYLTPWVGDVALARALGFFARLRERGFQEAFVSQELIPLIQDRRRLPEVRPFELCHDTTLASNPFGILAFNDRYGGTLIERFKSEGFELPDEVAVLGVDNDDLFCDTVSPALSSIDCGSYDVGYAAAALAAAPDRKRKVTAIAPRSVVTRESTDMLAVEDPALRRVLRFIRVNFAQQIDWNEVARNAGLGRRALERRFRNTVRCSPGKELQRVRMDHARHLLRDTSIPVGEVASACGYATPAQFHVIFRRYSGTTPAKYRRGDGGQ